MVSQSSFSKLKCELLNLKKKNSVLTKELPYLANICKGHKQGE